MVLSLFKSISKENKRSIRQNFIFLRRTSRYISYFRIQHMALFKKKEKTKDIAKAKEGAEEKEMSFIEHLEELRWHIVRSLSAILFFGILTFVFRTFVFDKIIFGPRNDDFPTYRFFCGLSDATCFSPVEFDLIAIQMGEQFFTAIKVSFWLGLIISFPYIFYEVWRFIKPGLYKKERKAASGIVFSCSFLFLMGVLFGYFVIAPFAINFLIGFDIGEASASPSLSSYVNYMTLFTVPTGILFQLPIFVYFFSIVGLITPELMKKYRRHAFIIILIIAAVTTPPDVITQFLIGVPVYVLYEFSIIISGRAAKKYQASLDED